jgi:hypothetical protein
MDHLIPYYHYIDHLGEGGEVEEREELAANLLGRCALIFFAHTKNVVVLHKCLRQKLSELSESLFSVHLSEYIYVHGVYVCIMCINKRIYI